MPGRHLPFRILTHKDRVRSLFKRAMRCVEDWNGPGRIDVRYEQVILRDRFDQNKCIKDEELARKLVADGEKELSENRHIKPKKWALTIGGTAYGRDPPQPDWLLDMWHPLEKAQYPEYFATREKRKKEYIKMWEEEYGSEKPKLDH